jgi:hypothetical protein
MARLADLLRGTAAEIVMLAPPALPPRGDAVEWVALQRQGGRCRRVFERGVRHLDLLGLAAGGECEQGKEGDRALRRNPLDIYQR